MSGILKGIGKVFKKVGKVLKKVALPVLAIGAVVLTGGAALGLLPAVSSVVGGLGLSAGLTTALTGVVSGAGWGGIVGGIVGGKKGFLKGAMMGGLTGGVLSATGALGAGGAGSTASAASGAAPAAPITGGGLLSSSAELAQGVAAVPSNLTAAVPSLSSAGVSGAAAVGSGGLLGSVGSNPYVVPSLIQGVGGALSANEQNKALSKREKKQAEQRAANYRVTEGLLTPDYRQPSSAQRLDPADRFSPAYYDRVQPRTQYVYDEQLGQVVEKKVA